jgi:hypothetical protein
VYYWFVIIKLLSTISQCIEETGTGAYGDYIQRYFAAEGVVHCHDVVAVRGSGDNNDDLFMVCCTS